MKRRMIDSRWLFALVIANAPLLAGAWNIGYPTDGSTVNTSPQGSGNADPSVTVTYEIVLNGTLQGSVSGTSNAGGGWNMMITGPMATGSGRTAVLKDGVGNVKDTSANITVQ